MWHVRSMQKRVMIFSSAHKLMLTRYFPTRKKLYLKVRELAKGDKRAALDKNYQIWKDKIKSDCSVLGYSFNDWGEDYAPDTDFQISECRKKIAAQELEFYKWLVCPDDMETSPIPKCAAIRKTLDERR